MSFLLGNPYRTTAKVGSFRKYSDGTFQGMAFADAASQNYLNMGTLSTAATAPIFGGVPVMEDVYNTNLSSGKPTLTQATSVGQISGFSVFDQGHNGVITPGVSNVPLFYPGMDFPFYRLGSKTVRIPVQCSPALSALVGSGINPSVGWDFTSNMLIPLDAGTAVTVSSLTINDDGTTTVVTASAHGLAIGMTAVLAGFTPAGYNGNIEVLSVPTSTSFTYATGTNYGAVTAQGTVATPAASAALDVSVIEYTPNSQVVFSDTVNNGVSWQPGTCAVILI